MQAEEFVLKSGKKFLVSMSDFEDAQRLTKALMKSAKGMPIAQNFTDMDISVLKDVLVEAATSDDVQAAIHKCMERSTYAGVKAVKGIFDDPDLGMDARRDYYEMSVDIIKVNCLPFFEQALSMLKTSLKTKASIQG